LKICGIENPDGRRDKGGLGRLGRSRLAELMTVATTMVMSIPLLTIGGDLITISSAVAKLHRFSRAEATHRFGGM
jgi:hypothetical protein